MVHHHLRHQQRNRQRNNGLMIGLTLAFLCSSIGGVNGSTVTHQNGDLVQSLRGSKRRKRVRNLSTNPEEQTHQEGYFGPEIIFDENSTTLTSENEVVRTPPPMGAQTRIVGGQNADPSQFWFYTMILDHVDGRKYFSGCGGTLITQCHILTAAHCLSQDRLERTDGAYVGTWQPYNKNGGQPFHLSDIDDNIDAIIKHEGYDDKTNEHDIAIIKLRKCVDPNRFPPVELARSGYDDTLSEGDELTVAGFGRIGQNDAERVHVLQEATVPVISHDRCAAMYQGAGRVVTSDTICAGYDAGGIDSCQGDSGGPLVQKISETDENGVLRLRILQVGVVSWGIGCARENRPGVYSNVPDHYRWIQQNACTSDDIVGANGLCDPPTNAPTKSPTKSPTKVPTKSPTRSPTASPTLYPSGSPSREPTPSPSSVPSLSPESRISDEEKELLRAPQESTNGGTNATNSSSATTTNTTTASSSSSSSSRCGEASSSTNSFTYLDQSGNIQTINCNSIPDDDSGDDLCKLGGAMFTCSDACDPGCRRQRRRRYL